MLQINTMHVIPRALVNTSALHRAENNSQMDTKNAGVIPTSFSRWLHKLLQSEEGTATASHSMKGPAWMHSHSWHSEYDTCSAFVDSLNSPSCLIFPLRHNVNLG